MLSLALLLALQDEAELSVRKLKPGDGLKVSLWASEPLLQNPVAFSIDERGRVFVAETGRYLTSVIDIRDYMSWFYEDAGSRRVADREALIKRRVPDWAKWAVESERVRLVEDVDGDGRAERSTVFAEGFNTLVDGVAAGVLAREGQVWFANIPNLWHLRDADGDGAAEYRKAMFTGFGVRFGFTGHDLHGPVQGPDGKLYFSVGDRGFSVTSAEGERLEYPDMGAVLRCDVDGSNLEVYAYGLRNPQDLAFDEFGELFTGDNSADIGDAPRWTQVVEGSDAGWRYGYQYASDAWEAPSPGDPPPGLGLRSPWVAEEIWKGKAAYVLPAVAFLDAGPAGIAYARGRFYLCEFPGGVRSFALKPKGAGYELVDHRKTLWNGLPTDCEFGPDGALYVLDWVEGWTKTGKGRIYKVVDPTADAAALEDARRRLAQDWAKLPPEELATLMGHGDPRVRLRAQRELVGRQGSTKLLTETARSGRERFARLHAIWGLGQLYTRNQLFPLLQDPDPEIRAQTARVLGERRVNDAHDPLVKALRDESPRVRRYAAASLGKLGRRESFKPLVDFLRENDGRDPVLSHAGAHALAMLGSGSQLLGLSKDPSLAVRTAALVATRRLARPDIEAFLDDPELAFEAARAIHDLPVAPALPKLAARLGRLPDAAALRAINANFRLGDAAALAAYSTSPAPAALRIEALRALAAWARPNPRDRVTGQWRPLPERDPAPAREALGKAFDVLQRDAELRVEAALAGASLGLPEAKAALARIVEDRGLPAAARAAAVSKLREPSEAVLRALDDPAEEVRVAAVPFAPKEALPPKLDDPSLRVRQAVVRALGPSELVRERLKLGTLPAALRLEAREALGETPPPEDLIEGGDPEAGRKIFFERGDVQCSRCHKAKGQGGTVGPDLSALPEKRAPAHFLMSMLKPNQEISPGYEQVVLATTSDAVEVGRVLKETPSELTLLRADGTRQAIAKERIKARKPGMSAMPEDIAKALTPRELRDLVAFLASLK